MKKWKAYVTGLVTVAGLSSNLCAQVPAVPAVPAAPAAAVPAATPVGGLHQFLGLTPEAKDAKRRRICATQFGQLLNNMLKPLSIFTGGVLGNFCPQTPSAADLAKGGAEGAAAKIQKDEAEAKARRAAVRYLGTVDCHYWPEAEKELINSLRNDRNECVRYEAAVALGGGCCCTKRTMTAMAIAATGSDKDGSPGETCERVRNAALASLHHCLACFSEEVPNVKRPDKPEPPSGSKPEKPTALQGSTIKLSAFYDQLEHKSMSQVVREAREATSGAAIASVERGSLPSGMRGMANIVANAMGVKVADTGKNEGEHPVVHEVASEKSGSSEPKPMKHSLFGPSMPEIKPAVSKPVASNPMMEVKPAGMARPMPSKPIDMKPIVTPKTPLSAAPRPVTLPAPAPVAQARPQTSAGANPQQMLLVLRNSIYPFQREWAVENLSQVDWHGNPEVVQALMNAARKDPAPAVRVMCIRSLVKMKVDTVPVVTTIQALRSDPDPRVEHEAQMALAQLSRVQPAVATSATPVAVQPAAYAAPAAYRGGAVPATPAMPARPITSFQQGYSR